MSVFEAVGACAAGHHHRRASWARSSARPARPRAAAPACSPPTPWRRSARRWACRCPVRPRPPAVDRRRDDFAYESGRAVVHLLELGLRPRQIMTKEAFENAIAVTMALGGSTNAVLHLLAIAYEARVDLELDDFNRIAKRVPHIADTKPHGKYHMSDLDRIGGVPVVMQGAARRRAAARRLPDRDRQDDGREPGRRSTRPRPTARWCTRWATPIHAGGRHRRAHRLAGPQGLGGQGGRHRLRPLRGPGPGVRRRGRGHGGDPGRPDQRRRRRGHPLRGAQGRAGHARDAGRDRGHEGRRSGRRRRPHHRRAVLGRHPRVLHRPRGARGGRRRPDRLRARRRPHRHRRGQPHHRPAGRRRPSWRVAGPSGSCPSPATPRACWPSTPGWPRAPRRAPSPRPDAAARHRIDVDSLPTGADRGRGSGLPGRAGRGKLAAP